MDHSGLQPSLVTPSTSASSTPRYTSIPSRSDEGEPSHSSLRYGPTGQLKLQTDFDAESVEAAAGRPSDDHSACSSSGKHQSLAQQESLPLYSGAEEAQVRRALDSKLVPLLAFLYLLSFLDRSNIGNAKIAGLMDDLNLSSSQYEWLLTAFYITYILFEWMTLMYRLVPPRIYISICVFSWGLVASLQSLATSFGTLAALRALLGIAEAAFGPGVPFYLSLFYRREELALRNGLFISAAPLASSFASSLAWLIVKVSSDGPIAPWRTLFLVEGFPSVIVAAFTWILIPDSPGAARFLTPRLRTVAQQRLVGNPVDDRSQRFDWQEVKKTLVDPKSYLTAFMFFSCNVAFSSMPVFLPTIIRDMGYSSVTSQALSAPPYLIAFATVLVTAYISDRRQSRSPYLILHALLASFAYLIIALTGRFHHYLPEKAHVAIRYFCVYPATAGFFSAITLIITWTMDNRVAKEGKGASIAILNVIGQCGPLLGTRLYPDSDGPWYVPGMAICSLFMAFVATLALILRVILRRLNLADTRRARGGEVDTDIVVDCEERDGLMGNRSRRATALQATLII